MRKHIILSVVLIALFAALCGCARTQVPKATAPAAADAIISQQKLAFSVTPAEEERYTVLSREELGGKTDADVSYRGFAEVCVRVGGVEIPLAEAIRDNRLTVPEIFAFARMDAENGFCQEEFFSEHGLTHFSYTYPECVLQLAYDVYETPNGNQTLMEEVYIADRRRDESHVYVDENSEWGYFLDREDWGLTFKVSHVSPTQITLDCTQRGGQQIGELLIDDYLLFPAEASVDPDQAPSYIGNYRKGSEWQPISISPGASGPITIDWSASAGTLEPGDYYLQLDIFDIYEESEVHPLMVNYYDKQRYNIAFSIPYEAEDKATG